MANFSSTKYVAYFCKSMHCSRFIEMNESFLFQVAKLKCLHTQKDALLSTT